MAFDISLDLPACLFAPDAVYAVGESGGNGVSFEVGVEVAIGIGVGEGVDEGPSVFPPSRLALAGARGIVDGMRPRDRTGRNKMSVLFVLFVHPIK